MNLSLELESVLVVAIPHLVKIGPRKADSWFVIRSRFGSERVNRNSFAGYAPGVES